MNFFQCRFWLLFASAESAQKKTKQQQKAIRKAQEMNIKLHIDKIWQAENLKLCTQKF